MKDEQFDIESRKCRTCSEEFKFGAPWVCQKCLVSSVFEVSVEIGRKNKKLRLVNNIIFMALVVGISIYLGLCISYIVEIAFVVGWVLHSIWNLFDERLK